jgi:hypothetical protein
MLDIEVAGGRLSKGENRGVFRAQHGSRLSRCHYEGDTIICANRQWISISWGGPEDSWMAQSCGITTLFSRKRRCWA